MKNASIALAALALLAGCTGNVPTESEVAVSSEALTLAQCGTQRDACFAKNGLFGILFCNAEYTACSATASNGLPAQVADAAVAAAECTTELDDCVLAATKPSELAACAEDQAMCVAGILDVTVPVIDLGLPPVVSGVTDCADAGIECIEAATSVSELTACGETLAECNVEVVTQGTAISDVVDCAETLDDCVLAATKPSELAACAEEQAICVSGALDVPLPDLPVSDVVECTESAAECTLEAESIGDVLDCAEGLVECGETVAGSIGVPPVLDCNAQWTRCLLTNPFAFGMCAQQLRVCLN